MLYIIQLTYTAKSVRQLKNKQQSQKASSAKKNARKIEWVFFMQYSWHLVREPVGSSANFVGLSVDHDYTLVSPSRILQERDID